MIVDVAVVDPASVVASPSLSVSGCVKRKGEGEGEGEEECDREKEREGERRGEDREGLALQTFPWQPHAIRVGKALAFDGKVAEVVIFAV